MSDFGAFLALLFFAVVFISQALLLPVAGKKAKHSELAKRLKETQQTLDDESKSLLQEHYLKGLTSTERFLIRFDFFESLNRMLGLSGLGVKISTLLGSLVVTSLLILFVCLATAQLWYLSVAMTIAPSLLTYLFIQRKIGKRLEKFEEQLPDAIDIIKRVLQAGQPINQAFNEVGKEMPQPIGEEFASTFNLLNYGYDMRLAIMQMVDRVPTVSIMAFSSAVLLQKETGGNLTENLDKVSVVLRARFKLSRKIKTLSAEARLSSWILVLSPFFVYLLNLAVNREMALILTEDPRGIKMVSAGIISILIGSLWIKKIVNIKV
ncbi:pilus assembly protein TadB [Vibrio breoganii]|uniref:type II secretion system F family protein n=1 Tax=Vibrio breoganii TaxID=553239 RepID=UPI000C83003F|nr:type II secretion system F family protein [Vibrio breoganii]PMK32528.1 pilus assembly protein TadB [Vibrio breoganii]TKG27171.1 pilus assembly protein TadB [Vibrio breoganii]